MQPESSAAQQAGAGSSGCALTPEAIDEALRGTFRRAPLPLAYQASLGAVALAVVLIPLAYVAVIGLVLWGMVWYGLDTSRMLANQPGDEANAIIRYFGPLLGGAILVAALLKPLVAPRGQPWDSVSLRPGDEPLLDHYIGALCRLMDAPLPRRIYLDVSPAAAASLGHGLRHVLAREPVLKIGLPLVAGLDLRQLSGVLAHELGHFRQGWAMRLWLLAGHITEWLGRSAYERDRWDERLERLSENAFPLVCCAAWVVQALVWCTRQVFRVLLRLAVALSASMSRQMEYDADRCEAQLAGSDSLEGTLRRSTELDLAWNIVLGELPVRFRERRLPDDLPAFVAAMATRLPAAAVAQVESIMTDRSTGLLACHPSIPRRIEAVRRLGEPGIVRVGAPASSLFADFGALCRRVTGTYYRGFLGEHLGGATLVATDRLVRELDGERNAYAAMNRYVPWPLARIRTLFPGVTEVFPAADAAASREALVATRGELAAQAARMEQRATGFIEACDRLTELKLAAELRRAGIRIRGKQIKLRWPTKRRLAREIERAEKHRQAWSEDLDPAVEAAKRRLLLALEVIEDPDSDGRIEGAAGMRRRLPKLLGALAAMDAAYEGTRELREALRSIEALWEHVERHGKNKPYIAAVEAAAARLHRAIGSTIVAMSGAEYPFDHARGHATLVEVIGIEVPSEHEHPLLLAEVASELAERFFDVYFRVLAELAAIGEAAEASLGLKPLDEEAEARPEDSPKQAA